MQLCRKFIEHFKIPSSRINQLIDKNCKNKYVGLKQGSMTMRKFITLDDEMAKDLRNARGDMSDQTTIEIVAGKISRSARGAMEKYKELQMTLGQLNAKIRSNWLEYSNSLMQVCSEIDVDSNGDGSSSEESEDDKPADRKKMTVPSKRQLTRDPY